METLRFGSKSEDVAFLQVSLQKLGFYKLGADSDFGAGTARAVALFQQSVGLTPDAIVGKNTWEALRKALNNNTTNVRPSYELQQVIDVMKNKGYRIKEQEGALNIVGIRNSDNFDNDFSDTLVCFWKEGGQNKSFTSKWTTKPGTLGNGGVFNPLTVLGLTGVAVLMEAQYQDCYTFVNDYRGWLSYPYFWQTNTVKVLRDGNRNAVIDYVSPKQAGLFGINLHRMSNNGVESDTLNSAFAAWSIGCQGAPEPQFRELVRLAQLSVIATKSNIFDYTLLNKNDFS